MNATHQSIDPPHYDVMAWQFYPTERIPTWAAQVFHKRGDSKEWFARSREGMTIVAKAGDWAVRPIEEKFVFLLDDKEFKDIFRPLQNK